MEEVKACDVWPQVHKVLWLPPCPHSGGNRSPCRQRTSGEVHVVRHGGPLPITAWCLVLETEPWAPSKLRTTTPLIDVLGAASCKILSQNEALRLYVSLLEPPALIWFSWVACEEVLSAGSLWQTEEAILGRPSRSHEQHARPALSLADGHSIWMRIL